MLSSAGAKTFVAKFTLYESLKIMKDPTIMLRSWLKAYNVYFKLLTICI